MLAKSAQTGRAPLREHKHDFYSTPPEAIRALLEVEKLPDCIWEPSCGNGAIVNILRERGHRVYATDLVDRSCPDSESGVDFLMQQAPSFWVGAIVTNPPFSLANQFVYHALMLVPKVVMLLRLSFLEGIGRSAILDQGRLARVHVFKRRLPMMHREGWQGKKSTNAIPFAWFVFDQQSNSPTTIDRI